MHKRLETGYSGPTTTLQGGTSSAALAAGPARASETVVLVYDFLPEFIEKTGALAQGEDPPVGVTTDTIAVGELALSHAAPSIDLIVNEWTFDLEGDDLAVSGEENLDFSVVDPVTEFGFEIYEPSVAGPPPGCNFSSCLDSTFELTLYLAGNPLESILINAPDDEAAFVGVHSNRLFDRIELRELTPDTGNEYFGELFLGRHPASVNYGNGTPGTGGFTPKLMPPSAVLLPGTQASIQVTDILGGAPTLLAVGLSPQSVQVAGIEFLVGGAGFLTVAPPGTPWIPGDGEFELPLQIPGGDMFAGWSLYLQVIVLDDGGPAMGLAASSGLELNF